MCYFFIGDGGGATPSKEMLDAGSMAGSVDFEVPFVPPAFGKAMGSEADNGKDSIVGR